MRELGLAASTAHALHVLVPAFYFPLLAAEILAATGKGKDRFFLLGLTRAILLYKQKIQKWTVIDLCTHGLHRQYI